VSESILYKITCHRDVCRFSYGKRLSCEFKKYPEYDNLKMAYSTEIKTTATFDVYTPERTVILACPKNVTADLPAMPKGKSLVILARV